MFTPEPANLTWLDTTVASLKAVRWRTTKSELVRLGLWTLRQKEIDELRELPRQVDSCHATLCAGAPFPTTLRWGIMAAY
jgi:hypothetical protein